MPLAEMSLRSVWPLLAVKEPELPLPKRTSRRYGSARLTLFELA